MATSVKVLSGLKTERLRVIDWEHPANDANSE